MLNTQLPGLAAAFGAVQQQSSQSGSDLSQVQTPSSIVDRARAWISGLSTQQKIAYGTAAGAGVAALGFGVYALMKPRSNPSRHRTKHSRRRAARRRSRR